VSALTGDRFAEFYKAVHGKSDDPTFGPFPWQERLARRVCAGDWPRVIALPTAAGKTACIDVAVFALACQAKDAPRRIFFVVDRRIVVDQAHLHAEQLACVLNRAEDGILRQVADVLRDLAEPGWLKIGAADRQRILERRWAIQDEQADGKRRRLLKGLAKDERAWVEISPLGVYALRGGMYRETAWARSPLQPTVIASTVDQVGSRLLFRGYGVSDSMRPIHAGLVGNDAIILLDEAHCARPFDQTMEAVERYRSWGDEKGRSPFRFVSLTATPAGDVPEAQIERDEKPDRDHDVLGPRIAASKPAKLIVAEKATGKKGQAELVKELVRQARKLAEEGFAAVGVIVNRVATARLVAKELGGVLLTGRMRPLDRDRVFRERLRPLLSNGKGTPPQFVVGTQCLEVGADFDFHALVTECASMDALRQRFGRLNRVAARPTAKAVVVVRADQAADSTDDRVYGTILSETWKWLKANATDDEFDFGTAAVRIATEGADLVPLNAPSVDAPVLFPAHLDCWVQTAPVPTPDPDPAVFLHGPQSGVPDVQVVFRADLGENSDNWADIVALCPPSSSEALPVRIDVFRRWLAGEEPQDQSSDVEGERENDTEEGKWTSRIALRWKGAQAKETGVVGDLRREVQPGETFVIRASAHGADSLGDFPTFPPVDHGDEAFQRSRDKAILRLTDLDLSAEDEEFEKKLSAAVSTRMTDTADEWLRRAVEHLSDPRNRTSDPHPLGGWVVTGRKRLYQFDPTFLEDDESFESPNRRSVTLEDHSRGVTAYAGRFAEGCGLPADTYTLAGLFHDLGKLDPRFQAMLQGRSPRTVAPPPLAKSDTSSGSRREREEAQAIHRYPKGGRHELFSAALVAQKTNHDLLLHLTATHHGTARPFAGRVDENDFATSPFTAALFRESFALESSAHAPAVWNAVLPERFWRVVRKYGWWGAAYREAVFRLADHARSRAEQEEQWESEKAQFAVPPLPPISPTAVLQPIELTGLDGSNPLAFLAALGTLRLADQAFDGEAKLSWKREGRWVPVIHVPPRSDLVESLHCLVHRVGDPEAGRRAEKCEKEYRNHRKAVEKALKDIKGRKLRGADRKAAIAAEIEPLQALANSARADWLQALAAAVPAPFLSLGKALAVNEEEFRTFARQMAERLANERSLARPDADFASAFGCEVCLLDSGRIIPTDFQLITGSGHQFFLETLTKLMADTTKEQLHRALFGPWSYSDLRLSFRWDPGDDRRYAYGWADPSDDAVQTEHGANLLGAFGLPLFPLMPTAHGPVTTGFDRHTDPPALTWPVWVLPFTMDVVRSLVATRELQLPTPDRNALCTLGVAEVFRTRKIEVGSGLNTKLNLTAAVTV
jgi:CRISPR-associated endonuclease/helicase Cas3